MTDKIEQEKKIDTKTLEKIKQKVDLLIKNGSSLDHAISVVCKVNEFNPTTVRNMLNKKFNMEKNTEEIDYKDIKNDEGSYVMLKKNPGKSYEVININNKDNIILMDLDNDSEVKVKEEDIIPIVTETKMKELNEAQYTVSIDNLETTDAETLSQMLSLAGQAEEPAVEEIDTVVDEPVVEPVGEFEPTIPATVDGPGFEAAEIDSMPADDFPSVEEEPTVDDMGYGVTVDDDMPVVDAEEDVVLPAEETEIVGESVEGEEGLSEDVLVPSEEKEEKEDPLTDSEDKEGMFEKMLKVIKPICADCNGDEAELAERINGLYEMGDLSEEEHDYIVNHFDELVADCSTSEGINPEDEEELKRDEEFEKRMDAKDIADEMKSDDDIEECGDKPVMEEDGDEFDAEIAETLRLAGVQLNEVSDEVAMAGKKDLPMPPIGKANPAAKEDAKGQEPNYQEPATEKAMGYEASKGFEALPNTGCICVKETVDTKKIDAIMETAKHMYAKKDSSEWLALDRRYVEKLIKEGVSYSNASKMLLKAKAGK